MSLMHTLFDVLLAVGLIGTAAVSMFAPQRVTSVLMFIVFGVLLAICWARLYAPDVALVEAILGAGVTGVLLLSAALESPRRNEPLKTKANWVVAVLGGLSAAALGITLAFAVHALQTGPGLGADVDQALQSTGVSHEITAVLLNLRSYDTLLEVAVLLVAAIIAVAVSNHRSSAGSPVELVGPTPRQALVRILAPVVTLIALWLLFAGSSQPGGAFHAGALLAGLVIMLHLGGGPLPVLSATRLLAAASAGVLMFIGMGALMLVDGAWLQWPTSISTEVIVSIELLLTVSICAALVTLHLAGAAAGSSSKAMPSRDSDEPR